MVKICPLTQFLNSETHLCEPCAANSGTSQLLQASCVSCGTMWWYETTTLESTANSIEYATAYKLCQNPETEYELEKEAELAKALAEQARLAEELAEEQAAIAGSTTRGPTFNSRFNILNTQDEDEAKRGVVTETKDEVSFNSDVAAKEESFADWFETDGWIVFFFGIILLGTVAALTWLAIGMCCQKKTEATKKDSEEKKETKSEIEAIEKAPKSQNVSQDEEAVEVVEAIGH